MRTVVAVFLSALLAASIGCTAEVEVDPDGTPPREDRPVDGAADTTRLSTRTVYQDQGSAIEDSRRLVLRSDAEWESFWREAHANRTSPEPAPEIDFDRSMVLAATMGQRSTGGHSIDVESVLAIDGVTRVGVVETSPGEGCLVTQALTAPAVAVAVDRRAGDVTWTTRQETAEC